GPHTLAPGDRSMHRSMAGRQAAWRCHVLGAQTGVRAERATGAIGNSSLLYWWCDRCGPSSARRLYEIRTYKDALNFARLCGRRRANYHHVIRAFAVAKGLRNRPTRKRASEFFG